MEIEPIASPSLLGSWHRLHFWDSLMFKGRRNRLTRGPWTRMERRLEEAGRRHGPGRVIDLPRVGSITPEEFHAKHIVRNEPVVLAGAAKDWACVREWTPEYFAERYGHFDVMTVEGRKWGEDKSGSLDHHLEVQDHKVADLIADILKGGSRYASFYPFFRFHPELMEHFDVAFLERYSHLRKILPWQRRIFPKLFLGGAGTSTPTHCAGIYNLFVQIYGEKQWDLWHPDAAPFLYPEFNVGNNAGTYVDFRDVDLDRFPLYNYPDRYRTVLKPGDILFVPAWWWHAVQNLTTSISVSNFVLRVRSGLRGRSFSTRAAIDPWSLAVFFLASEGAAKEWEVNLPKLLFSTARLGYWGNVLSFAHFVATSAAGKLGLRRN